MSGRKRQPYLDAFVHIGRTIHSVRWRSSAPQRFSQLHQFHASTHAAAGTYPETCRPAPQIGGYMSVSWFRVMALVVAMACTATATVSAQSVGSIAGTVMDPSKGALPGAVVTARNEGTGAVREVVTDAEGRYAMPLLPIGSYTVTATMTGFQTPRRSRRALEVQQSLTLDFALDLSALTDEITVTSQAAEVHCNAAMRRSAS